MILPISHHDKIEINRVCAAILSVEDSSLKLITDNQIKYVEWIKSLPNGLIDDHADINRFASTLVLLRSFRENIKINAHWDSSIFSSEIFPTATDRLFERWISFCLQPDVKKIIWIGD